MHLPDGFLSPQLTLPAFAVAAPLWVAGARRHLGRDAADALPVLGCLTALAFVLQTIQIPVPGGTSVHVVGVTLLALTHGPLAAFVCESLVLLVQALFFGAGGVTVLAVNALAMGLVGPAAAWLAHRLLRRLSERAAAFAAGYVALQLSSLCVAGVLGLQHALSPDHFPVPFTITLAATMLPSLTAGGLAEGAYTLFALGLVKKVAARALA